MLSFARRSPTAAHVVPLRRPVEDGADAKLRQNTVFKTVHTAKIRVGSIVVAA
jgi:hypothetical protein